MGFKRNTGEFDVIQQPLNGRWMHVSRKGVVPNCSIHAPTIYRQTKTLNLLVQNLPNTRLLQSYFNSPPITAYKMDPPPPREAPPSGVGMPPGPYRRLLSWVWFLCCCGLFTSCCPGLFPPEPPPAV